MSSTVQHLADSMKTLETQIRNLLDTSFRLLFSRFEAEPDYPFVNTKFDIVSGRDFAPEDEFYRRKDCIYAWIQGRGLESLAGHAGYYRRNGDLDLAKSTENRLYRVATKLESCRAAAGGRLPFAFRPDGSPVWSTESAAANFSDLFYSKGLFAAGVLLEQVAWEKEAEQLFRQVLSAIQNREFRTDQHGFDDKNPVSHISGKYPQGPRMIALGGLALFAEARPPEAFWLDTAAEFIEYILEYHVNTGQIPTLQKHDFVEALDKQQCPWCDGSTLLCDPGHALEFIGLAAKCLLIMQKQRCHLPLLKRCRKLFSGLFLHLFKLGFAPAGGIVKSYDLLARKPINDDMPWWSLPESMRAAAELLVLCPAAD
ncbi:MAG: AGE family epimerase/isomerase, partial [Lentisphaeria bacterium]